MVMISSLVSVSGPPTPIAELLLDDEPGLVQERGERVGVEESQRPALNLRPVPPPPG